MSTERGPLAFLQTDGGPLPSEEALVVDLLRGAPWGWPPSGTSARAHALRLAPDGPGPATLLPLVTTSAGGGALWAWAPRRRSSTGTPLGPVARNALDDAVAAAARALPVAWTAPHQRGAMRVQLAACAPGACADTREVDGRSLGLSFLLGITASSLGLPLPADVLATATVDEFGNVGPVEGISDKLTVATAHAPGLRTVLVASEQVDTTRGHLEGQGATLSVQGVATARDALEQVFGKQLQTRLRSMVEAPGPNRDRVLRWFMHLARSGRSALVAWRAVADTATAMLEHAAELPPDQHAWVALVHALARRHDGDGAMDDAPALPGLSWLDRLPPPARDHALAHLVQQHTDTGAAPPEGFAVLSTAVRERIDSAQEPTAGVARLRGAWARWLALSEADLAVPLALQRQALRDWQDLYQLDEASYPLCEVYRLAAVQRDEDALDEADRALATLWDTPGVISGDNEAYLVAAAARAGRTPPALDGPLPALLQVARGEIPPGHLHLRVIAWRSIVQQAPTPEIAALARQGLSELAEAQPEPRGRAVVETSVLLLELADRADDPEAAARVLAQLEALSPQGLRHLLCHAPADRKAAWVVSRFPY